MSKIDLSRYKFVLQPDITAFELACILPLSIPGAYSQERFLQDAYSKWTPEMFRHITDGEQLREEIERARKEMQDDYA